jgi:hypothetical protein
MLAAGFRRYALCREPTQWTRACFYCMQSLALPQQGRTQMADEPKAPVPISSEPVRTVNLPYESARRLSILPRIKYYNESTAAAFAGTVAAFPSAANALVRAATRQTFGLEMFETIQVLICFGFLVWLVASLLYSREEKTSAEYLDELYGPSEIPPNRTTMSSNY